MISSRVFVTSLMRDSLCSSSPGKMERTRPGTQGMRSRPTGM